MMRALQNLTIFVSVQEEDELFEVTGGRVLKRPAREPWN